MNKLAALLALLCVAAFAQQGTFTDPRDGKKYRTVEIGEQTWMAENLNYGASGSKCYEDNASNCNSYGRLYDWKTAMKACPSGWRLPSGEEWCSLISFVGEAEAGLHLKAAGGWNDCSYDGKAIKARLGSSRPRNDWSGKPNGMDTYRFSALSSGGGCNGSWWSSTTSDTYDKNFKDSDDMAYSLLMNSSSDVTSMTDYYKPDLQSVRCLKSENSTAVNANEKAEIPSCATQNTWTKKPDISIDDNAIFMKKKEIVKTALVAEQSSMQIEALAENLRPSDSRNSYETKIQVAPNVRYNVLLKVLSTLEAAGHYDVAFVTRLKKDEDMYSSTVRSSQLNITHLSKDKNLNLSVFISKDYFEIHARGGSLPRIYFKESFDAASKYTHLWALNKKSDKDPGTVLMSVYSKNDSAYVKTNNEFITNMSDVSIGSVVATLAESSARKLACGRTAPGMEDICEKGKPAISLKPRSAYDELSKTLIMLHNRFIDNPDANYITIFAEDDITFDKVFSVMDRARNDGFFKIKLEQSSFQP